MGYTHYYLAEVRHPAWRDGIARLADDAIRIIETVRARGIAVERVEYGPFQPGAQEVLRSISPLPMANDEEIAFNGWGTDEDGDDLGCEALWLHIDPVTALGDDEYCRLVHARHGGRWWDFCKTERYPYDLAVAAVLLRAAVLMPECFWIASDGQWDMEWRFGAEHFEAGCRKGYGARQLVADLFGDCPQDDPLGRGMGRSRG